MPTFLGSISLFHCASEATSGYNGGPGSVGGTTYASHGYDPYGQTQHAQHAYGTSAMQPQAPSSPYGRSGGGAYGGGGGFGSAMGAPPANPYATAAAPVPARSLVRHMAFMISTVPYSNFWYISEHTAAHAALIQHKHHIARTFIMTMMVLCGHEASCAEYMF